MSNFTMVKDFHKKFFPDNPDVFWSEETVDLHLTLMEEEFNEVVEAIEDDPHRGYEVQVLKELVDLLYVTYGTAVALGLDIDEAFHRVHKSNMSKLGDDGLPVYRIDGKALKGPNYEPPYLTDLVEST